MNSTPERWARVPVEILSNRVVGAGQAIRPLRPMDRAFHRFEAWLWLNMSAFTVVNTPGHDRAPITLDLADDGSPIPDVSTVWRWRPSDARSWLTAVCEDGLITDALHAEIIRRIGHRRGRSRRRQIRTADRATVLAKTSGKCVYCGIVLALKPGSPNSYQADHVLPVTLGGGDDIANLVPSCHTCNQKKRALTVLQLMGARDE